MGVYALTSLSGSPGVTAAAACWAMTSTRPTIVIEADPAGGSPILAGAFGSRLEHTTSVLNLATPRAGVSLMDRLMEQALPFPNSTDALLVPGIASPEQATSLRAVWPSLGAHLQKMSLEGGYDILLDLGRMTYPLPTARLLNHVDALAIFARSDLPSLHVLVSGLANARKELGEDPSIATNLTRAALVLVDAPAEGNPASSLKAHLKPVPLVATVPHTPAGVRPFSLGTPIPTRRGLDKITKADHIAKYTKAVASMSQALRAHAASYADTLIGE